MLTFLGTQGDRILLLLTGVMLWAAFAAALEFAGLAQRTGGWARWRALFWGTVLMGGGALAAQTLSILPAVLGNPAQAVDRPMFFILSAVLLVGTTFYALHLITRLTPTMGCIITASASLTVGHYGMTFLSIYYLLPVQALQFDWWLLAAGAIVSLATKTGTFAITTIAAGTRQRFFAAGVLLAGLAVGRFLMIIGTTGLPLTEAVSNADRVSIFNLGLHASPVMVMIGSVSAVTTVIAILTLLVSVRPWRANRARLRTQRAQDLRRRLVDTEAQRQTLEDRLADMTRQRDLALADRARTLASVQAAQATLNQEIAQRRQILDEHRQLLERQAQQHGTFVATAVHETRHRVQAILVDLTRVIDPLRADLTPEQRRLLTRMSDESDYLLGLLCTLSDYARLQGPLQSLSLRPVPALEVLGRLRNTLDPIAREAGVQIDWPQDMLLAGVALQTDPERLYQILAELIRNGVRFNRPGGSVSVAIEPVTGRGAVPPHLRLVVADTGVGIAPDLAAVLFSPFARRPATLPMGPGVGSGLGLAIAQRLAQSLKTSIAFASEPGIGSRFWLDVPAASDLVSVPVRPPLPQSRALDYPAGAALKAAQ